MFGSLYSLILNLYIYASLIMLLEYVSIQYFKESSLSFKLSSFLIVLLIT